MIEHAIQDDVHIICLCHLYQLGEVTQRTKDRVDLCIVCSIISVA